MESTPGTLRTANHLEGQTSPYLLQHVYNPVDWYPWGDEALVRARNEDRPIFLSIGYSACHWCHVMERESFENPAIAELLNDSFVCIKVDREERPDLDEIYMTAVVSLTGSGGWPMSVFLTPALEPFYGGTYFPPTDLYGRPGFSTVIAAVAGAWKNRRGEVEQSAKSIAEHLRQRMSTPPSNGRSGLSQDLLIHAARQLQQSFDKDWGGWGGAPKFPSSGSIQVLLRAHTRKNGADGTEALSMVERTLDSMMQGGLYDHLGGGFHRYSVDARWLVPHFEKMLYDNAQLAQAYLEAFRVTGHPRYRRVVEETLDYEVRDMQEDSGAFHSTEDADSEGEEGKFYVWTHAEVVELLGAEDAAIFAAYYTVKPGGNFDSHETYHRGQNILHVTRPIEEVAASLKAPVEDVETVLKRSRERLFAARQSRTRPGLDDKILTSWNGLMITALAQAAQTLEAPHYAEAAVRAGTFLWEQMVVDGKLLRTHRHGVSRLPGYLDDYAFTANAFVDIYEATFDLEWLTRAKQLADWMLAEFWDDTLGAFYYTSADHQHLLVRTCPTYDGAEPSGNSIATLALLRLHHFHNLPDYHHKAMELLERNHLALAQTPQGYLKLLCAADYALGPVKEVVIIGAQEDERTRALLRAVQTIFTPRTILACSEAPEASEGAALPLFAGRTLVKGVPAAYVCENYTCEAPVTDPAALREKLQ